MTMHYLGIADLDARLRARATSPVEVVEACLARLETLDPRLNAFITVLSDQAREQARAAEAEIAAGRWRGPLHGIPVGIKDFYDTASVRTTAAFAKFAHRVPKRDAVAVTRLKEAGAIIVGKTNMRQLGMGTTGLDSHFGPVRNPWNDAYVPGGSSSGSAAAVAAGLCWATLDTDAIGSCRMPAACCGVVGFKGTYGLISTKGMLDGEPADDAIVWLSHPVITTRRVEDVGLVLDVLAERPVPPVVPGRLRIGTASNVTIGKQVTLAFDRAIETLGSLGHEIVPARVPLEIPPIGHVETIEVDRAAIAGRAFAAVDVLLLPTTPTTVVTVARARGNPMAVPAAHTVFANYFGVPAVSIPCGFDRNGLPLGLQIVGRPWDDAVVLGLARQYETATAWKAKHPIE